MSPYAVNWTDDALADLTDIWNRAADPLAVTKAPDRLYRLLAALGWQPG